MEERMDTCAPGSAANDGARRRAAVMGSAVAMANGHAPDVSAEILDAPVPNISPTRVWRRSGKNFAGRRPAPNVLPLTFRLDRVVEPSRRRRRPEFWSPEFCFRSRSLEVSVPSLAPLALFIVGCVYLPGQPPRLARPRVGAPGIRREWKRRSV